MFTIVTDANRLDTKQLMQRLGRLRDFIQSRPQFPTDARLQIVEMEVGSILTLIQSHEESHE